jgi:hypothetical protein
MKRDINGNLVTEDYEEQEKKLDAVKKEVTEEVEKPDASEQDVPFDQVDKIGKEDALQDIHLAETTKKEAYNSGIWLFTDRNNITHFFEPNFLPPYTGEKRELILEVLKEEWDERTLSWKPCGQGSMTKKKSEADLRDDSPDVSTREIVQREDNNNAVCGSDLGASAQQCHDAAMPLYEKVDEMLGEVISQIRDSCMPKEKPETPTKNAVATDTSSALATP